MRKYIPIARRIMATGLVGLLIWTNAWAWSDWAGPPPLNELVSEPYLVLLERVDEIRFTQKELDQFRKNLKREEKAEKARLKREEKVLDKQLKGLRKQLADLNKERSRDTEGMRIQRSALHCQIETLEKQLKHTNTVREHGLPLSYDNKLAKVDLIEKWPAKKEEIAKTLNSGQARERRFGDVEDIGVRVLKEGQEKDIKVGEEAIRDMKQSAFMPPEVEDEELTAYVRQVADKIAAHSDLKVPLKVTILASEEINAFALPGGFLFVNTGLIDKAETESELAGVLAHEIAHVTARHGARLMSKANIANILFQAAQVAALVFTGGVVGVGAYYALQYGFFGLGMVLDLSLLGVSRDYEEEADQLGAQYAWNAGYDPRGFITFFDKMASEKGYVQSASFFRTHPPFFKRIVSTFSEIEYLPPKENLIVDTTEFQQVQERLQDVIKEERIGSRERPKLRRTSECDEKEHGVL
ncbi:M48 family metallopeptidase [Acidobacteria bacterium AH-259-D05]|nr:M48 family metallopeptidase [Acidobacteria bacterium AH-259-D05]